MPFKLLLPLSESPTSPACLMNLLYHVRLHLFREIFSDAGGINQYSLEASFHFSLWDSLVAHTKM